MSYHEIDVVLNSTYLSIKVGNIMMLKANKMGILKLIVFNERKIMLREDGWPQIFGVRHQVCMTMKSGHQIILHSHIQCWRDNDNDTWSRNHLHTMLPMTKAIGLSLEIWSINIMLHKKLRCGKTMSLVPKYIEEIQHLLFTSEIIKACCNLYASLLQSCFISVFIFGRKKMQLDMPKKF